MFIAVEGCSHGELDAIYQELANMEQQRKIKVDLLICCGDFQAVRSYTDLECMAVPQKYRRMQDFYKYYVGEKVAPVLTIFIGGNHEASNHLQELFYGGWAAPNIYYMGAAGCVVINGALRIAGLSGIFKQYHYLNGHFEMPPYDNNTLRSVYHYRNLEVFRLRLLSGNVDVMLSHDWPAGIYEYGNPDYLLRKKPFFRADMEKGELGGWPAMKLLRTMQPRYWFSAHLHVSFRALVNHEPKPTDNSKPVPAVPKTSTQAEELNVAGVSSKPVDFRTTQFQSLDKCLPRRHYLEIFEINPEKLQVSTETPVAADTETSPRKTRIEFDAEWLAVLKATNHLLSVKQTNTYMPATPDSVAKVSPSPALVEEVRLAFNNDLEIKPEWFYRSVPSHSGDGNKRPPFVEEPTLVLNEQTTRLCKLLKIADPLQALLDHQLTANSSSAVARLNPAEISFFDDEDEEDTSRFTGVCSSTYHNQQQSTAGVAIIPNVVNLTEPNGTTNGSGDGGANQKIEPQSKDLVTAKVSEGKGNGVSDVSHVPQRPALLLPPPVHVTVDNVKFSESIPL